MTPVFDRRTIRSWLRTLPRLLVRAGSGMRVPVRRASAMLSIGGMLLLVAAIAWPVEDAALTLDVGNRGHVPVLTEDWDAHEVEFTPDGLLANVTVLENGVALPVLGVGPEDLRDSFGRPRQNDRRHKGIDIGAPKRTPIAAALDGWIYTVSNGATGGLGLHIVDRTGKWLLYYAHLDAHAPGLYSGQAVRRGELLGYVGTTGNARGWPHLHFEVTRLTRPDQITGRVVNPYDFLLGQL